MKLIMVTIAIPLVRFSWLLEEFVSAEYRLINKMANLLLLIFIADTHTYIRYNIWGSISSNNYLTTEY